MDLPNLSDAAKNHPSCRCSPLSRLLCYLEGMNRTTSDHARLDERSLALHRRVAKKILADPALLGKARANVRRWQAAGATPSPALSEWESILDEPVEEVVALLTERSERAARLRQSNPFAGILTEAERRAIYESYATRARNPRRKRNLGR
jgi:hypothetical protein